MILTQKMCMEVEKQEVTITVQKELLGGVNTPCAAYATQWLKKPKDYECVGGGGGETTC